MHNLFFQKLNKFKKNKNRNCKIYIINLCNINLSFISCQKYSINSVYLNFNHYRRDMKLLKNCVQVLYTFLITELQRYKKKKAEHTTFIAIFKNYIIDIFNNNRNLNYQNMLKFIR